MVREPPPRTSLLSMNHAQKRIADAQYGPGAKVFDNDLDGQIGAGDVIQKANGERVTFNKEQAIDFNQRANIVKNALSNPKWEFTPDATPKLKGPNDFWELKDVPGKDFQMMSLKPGANPAAAVEDLRKHPERYEFDCAGGVRALNLLSTLDTIGKDDFNHSFQSLNFYGKFDSTDGKSDGGEWNYVSHADYNNGEWGRYDPQSGDQLVPGDWRWYENPTDNTTENNGWNVIYLGKDESGKDQFWRIGKTFVDSNPGATGTGEVANEYLSGVSGTTDINKLLYMDRTEGNLS